MLCFLATNWFIADVNFGDILLLSSQLTLNATKDRMGPESMKRDEQRSWQVESYIKTRISDTGKGEGFHYHILSPGLH